MIQILAAVFISLLLAAPQTLAADRLEAHVPMDPPPLDPELEKLARKALGI